MAATANTSGRKWLYFGACWLGLLGVVTGVAKVGGGKGAPAGRAPDGWAAVVPPFEVPNLTFSRASETNILNYDRLEEFAKNLQADEQLRVIIEGRAASDGEADRQLAAIRADFVKGKLAELGVDGDRVVSNRVTKSSQGGVTFDVRSRQKSATKK